MGEKKKMGRPTDNPRLNKISIRLSDDELSMLNGYAEKYGVTKTEVIARGIEKLVGSNDIN